MGEANRTLLCAYRIMCDFLVVQLASEVHCAIGSVDVERSLILNIAHKEVCQFSVDSLVSVSCIQVHHKNISDILRNDEEKTLIIVLCVCECMYVHGYL